VCILGPTKPEWVLCDLGAYTAALVPVGLYPNQSALQYRHIITHSDCSVIFVAGEDELIKVLQAVEGNDKVLAIVPWEEELFLKYSPKNSKIESWSTYVTHKEISQQQREILAERISKVKRSDCALLIYTSGTTGFQKGCILTHHSVLSLLNMFQEYSDRIGCQVYSFSFLLFLKIFF